MRAPSIRTVGRTKSRAESGEVVLLTDDVESTIEVLKAEAAARRAKRRAAAKAKGGLRATGAIARSITEDAIAIVRTPSALSRSLSLSKEPKEAKELKDPKDPKGLLSSNSEPDAGGNGISSSCSSALPKSESLEIGKAAEGTPTIPRCNTDGESALQLKIKGRAPIPRRQTADIEGIKEDDVASVTGASSVAGANDNLAPGSPFSSRASSYSLQQSSTGGYSERASALARLPRLNISKFSLASAPVSPTISAVPTPASSSVLLPPPSPTAEDMAGQGSCFTFITPKQIEGGVQTPVGWCVSQMCTYQAVVFERQQHLFVVRHAERLDVADPSWKETADRPWDPPLSEKGKTQAFMVGARIRGECGELHRVVCSPYLRCVETAAEIVKALLASDEELEELSKGAQESAKAAKATAATGPSGATAAGTGGGGGGGGDGGALENANGGVPTIGFRSQLMTQMTARGQTEQEPKRRNIRGKRATKKTQVRVHIQPSLCEIRTNSASLPTTVPNNRVLLPREQLESLLPAASLRSTTDAPTFMPPAWPEDVASGLQRLVGTADRICEQYPNENLIIVTHSEALHASIMRCLKKATVYNIKFAGYVHLERTVYVDTEDEEDRGVSPWKLITRSGTSGVYYTNTTL